MQVKKRRAALYSFKAEAVLSHYAKQNIVARCPSRKFYEELLTKHAEWWMIRLTVKLSLRKLPPMISKWQSIKNCKWEKISKFPKKILLRQEICSCGLKSQAFISIGRINQKIYKKMSSKATITFGNCVLHYIEGIVPENAVTVVSKECKPSNSRELVLHTWIL